MADLKTYPVLSRIRHSGVVYQPNGERSEIELSEKDAAPLKRLGCISEPSKPGELKDLLLELRDQGVDIGSIKMDEVQRYFGSDARGVRRKDVDAALAEIAADEAS